MTLFLRRFWIQQRCVPAVFTAIFHRFDDHSIEQLQAVNEALLDKVHRLRKVEILLIDLDSSHMDTYGQQENASYNTYYGTSGFHPLLTFDGLAKGIQI